MKKEVFLIGLLMIGVLGCYQPKPQADFIAQNSRGQAPLNVKFIDNSTYYDLEPVHIEWDFGDNQTSQEENPIHTYQEAGLYTVSLTVATSAGSDTKVKKDLIRVLPNVGRQADGLYFSPYKVGQSPGDFVSEDQIRDRLEIIQPYTFKIGFHQPEVNQIAQQMQFETTGIIWLNDSKKNNNASAETMIAAAQNSYMNKIMVGEEVLMRGDLPSQDLVEIIQEVKGRAPEGTAVGYSDSWHILLEYPEVVNECHVIWANIYPYWENIPAEEAVFELLSRYEQLQARYPAKKIIIRTGWPSDDSREEACQYFSEFINVATINKIEYQYFSAFDEEWRGLDWGIWTQTGQMKSCMEAAFQ